MKFRNSVLLADVHYELNSFYLADTAVRKTVDYCAEHRLPLVIAGDLHSTKAQIRAECANGIIETLKYAQRLGVEVYVIPGNHCLLNEKALDHALHFLKPYCHLIDTPSYVPAFCAWFIPYQNSSEQLEVILKDIPKGSTLIMHQGLLGAHMGSYVTDKTSARPEMFDGYTVFSGHYHRAQKIKCGKTGMWHFIGSPYSITAAEAQDGPKGFRVLNSDGTLDLIPLGLRKHVTVNRTVGEVMNPIEGLNPEDILCIKVKGTSSELAALSKKEIGLKHLGHADFELEHVTEESVIVKDSLENKTDEEILDSIIMRSEETGEQKAALCSLWREIIK